MTSWAQQVMFSPITITAHGSCIIVVISGLNEALLPCSCMLKPADYSWDLQGNYVNVGVQTVRLKDRGLVNNSVISSNRKYKLSFGLW